MANAVIERDLDYETQYANVTLISIRIDNYFKNISRLFLQQKAGQVWKVVFCGATSLQNVVQVLKNVENLEILEFRDVSLDHYDPNHNQYYQKQKYEKSLITSSSVEKEKLEESVPCASSRLVQLRLLNSSPEGKLTRSEILLLDFLTNAVQLDALSTLEISNCQRPGSRSRTRSRRNRLNQNRNQNNTQNSHSATHPEDLNEVHLQLRNRLNGLIQNHGEGQGQGQDEMSLTLVKFILKHSSTVKDLKLSRDNLEFVSSMENRIQNKTSLTLTDLRNIQLRYLTATNKTLGIHHLLKSQKSLENLCCENTLIPVPITNRGENLNNLDLDLDLLTNSYKNYIDLCTAFGSCIQNCWNSLWTAKTSGIVPIVEEAEVGRDQRSLESQDQGHGHELVYDFSHFQYCTTLRHLKLDNAELQIERPKLTGSNSKGEAEVQRSRSKSRSRGQCLSLSTFINGDFLPITLSTLIIKVGRVIPEEFEKITVRIPSLVNLKQFVLSSKTTFEVNLNCLENMLGQGQSQNQNQVENLDEIGRIVDRVLYNIELENAKMDDNMSANELQMLLQGLGRGQSQGQGQGQGHEQAMEINMGEEEHTRLGRRQRTPYWTCEIRPRGIFFEKWVHHL